MGSGHPHHPAHRGAVCPHRPAVPVRLWLAARRAGKSLSHAGRAPLPRRTGTPPRGGRSLPWPWGCGCSCSRPASAGCGSSPARPCPWGRRCSPCAAGTPPHYINLAEQGYDGYVENGQHLFLVFYPAYVWLLRAGAGAHPPTPCWRGCSSPACAMPGAAALLYRLARLFYPHAVARDGVLFLSLFPFSFFFGAAMTEGLFLLSTGAAAYYACRGKWLPLRAVGGFGGPHPHDRRAGAGPGYPHPACREKPLESPLGPLPGPVLEKRLLRALPCLLLPLLGTLGYLALNYAVDGDPFAFLTPPGTLVPGAHVGLPGAAVRVGLPAPLLECLQRLGHLAAHAPAVPAVLRPPPLGDPSGPAGRPGASGLRLLLSDG